MSPIYFRINYWLNELQRSKMLFAPIQKALTHSALFARQSRALFSYPQEPLWSYQEEEPSSPSEGSFPAGSSLQAGGCYRLSTWQNYKIMI